MNTKIFLCLMMIMMAACPLAFGQLLLTAGDRCTCPFGPTNFIIFPTAPSSYQPVFGEVLIRYSETSLLPGTVLRYEMFENSAAQQPICTGFITETNLNPGSAACRVNNAWGDLQGTVRLTMVSGSVVLNSVSFQVGKFSNGEYQRWQGGLPLAAITTDPQLRITRVSNGLLQISWPTNDAAYVLEQTQALPAATWSSLTNGVTSTGGQFSILVANSQEKAVFRLRKP